MPTYFNYVEREADSYVNWADVGRDMSNTIDDIQRVREEKKALIEKTYREDLKFIQDNPTGEHENLRTWALNMGQSSAEMMRLQNTLLKQGKLNLNNYLSFRQNLTDSVEKIYTVNSQLQEAFKEVNDRTKKSANQQLERETKVLLEKYGKLEDTEAYINPLNGTIYLGLTEIAEEDGKSVRRLKKGDGTYLSPDQLQAAAMQKFDAYNEQADLDKWVEGTGEVVQDIRQIGNATLAGMITSVTDVTSERILSLAKELPEGSKLSEAQMKALEAYVADFKKGENDYINGILANPYNASALLTDRIKSKNGKTYNIVFNKADQKTEYDIYVDKTDSKFTPVFDDTEAGKKQKEVLVDFLKGQLRVKYDRKVEMKPYTEPTPPRPIYQGGGGNKNDDGLSTYKTYIDYIKELRTGSPAVKQSRFEWLTSLPGVDQALTNYNANTGELIVYSSDPNKPYPFKYKFGDKISNEDFVIQLSGLVLPKETAKFGYYLQNADFSGAEDPNLPLGSTIRDLEATVADLKQKNTGVMKGLYDIQIKDYETKIADLKKQDAAQRQSGGKMGNY